MDDLDTEELDDSNYLKNKILPSTSRIKPHFDHGTKYQKYSAKICYEDNSLDVDNFSEDNDDDEDDDVSDDNLGYIIDYNEAVATISDFETQENHSSNRIIIGSKPNNKRKLGLFETDSHKNISITRSKRLESQGDKRVVDIDDRRNSRQKRTIVRKLDVGIPCNHCTRKFPGTNALTDHLYKLIAVKLKNNEVTESDSKDEEITVKNETAKDAECKEEESEEAAGKESTANLAAAKQAAAKRSAAKKKAIFKAAAAAKEKAAKKVAAKKAAAKELAAKKKAAKEVAAKKEAAAKEKAVKEAAAKDDAAAKKAAEREAKNSPAKKAVVQEVNTSDGSGDEETLDIAFKCPECGSLFKIAFTLLKHLKFNHDIIVSDALKFSIPAPTNPLYFDCPHCIVITTSFTAHNAHIKRKHYNLFGKSNQETTAYKCLICNDDFNEYNRAKFHRHTLHPEMRSKPILKKCLRTPVTKHAKVKRNKKPNKKTIAYKCLICNQIFHSYYASKFHRKRLHPQMRNKTILKRIVRKQSSAPTKVIRKEVSIKVAKLVHKPKERAFHRKVINEDSQIASRNNATDLIHDQEENIDKQTESNLNDESEDVNAKTNISKETTKSKLWFCDSCECFFPNQVKHNEEYGECKKMKNKKQLCHLCGLYFTSDELRKHVKIHEEKKITLHDYTFFNVINNIKIIPKPPEYPRCSKCRIHLVDKINVMLHSCGGYGTGDDSIICGDCNKKFCPLAYKLHTQFHLYGKAAQESNEQSQNDDIPQEIESSTWNILYTCSDCGTFIDKYDHAVEHSQNHCNNIVNTKKNYIKTCEVCDMEFEQTAFLNHKNLHQSSEINRNNFKILKYNYRDLLTGNWLKLFDDLPKQYMDYIISKSKYRATQNVRMKIRRGGCGTMFYQCAMCNKYINENSIYRHTHNGCFAADGDHEKVTEIGRQSRIVSFNHEFDFHFNKMLKIDDKSDRNETEKPDNAKNQTLKTKIKVPSNKAAEDNNKASTSVPAMKVFKCKCGLHFTSLLTIERHFVVCPSDGILSANCSKCNLLFPTDNNILVNHAIKHQRNDWEVVVEDFVPKMREVVLYECARCSLLFPHKADALKHSDCGTNVGENCNDCHLIFHTDSFKTHECTEYIENDIVTLDSTQDTITNDDTEDTVINETETSESINDLIQTIYKCAPCDIHYLNIENWFRHVELNHIKGQIVICEVCTLNYTATDITKHKTLHHNDSDKMDYLKVKVVGSDTIKEFQVLKDPTAINKIGKINNASKDILDNTDGSIGKKRKRNDNKLYKCNKCPQHFVTRSSWIKHIYYSTNHCAPLTECPDCKYTFSATTLYEHQTKHHEIMKLNRKRIRIVHYSDSTETKGGTSDVQLINTESSDELKESLAKRIKYTTDDSSMDETDDEENIVSSSTKICM